MRDGISLQKKIENPCGTLPDGAAGALRSGISASGHERRFGDLRRMSDLHPIVLQNPVVFIGDRRPEVWVAGLSPFPLPRHQHGWPAQLLHWASSCRRWWGTPEQLDEPLQILR